MRRTRLSTLLVAINVLLLLLAVAGVAVVAVHLLQRLADEQALARVGQAGASAENALARSGDDLLTVAQVLAERPTLKRELDAGDGSSLAVYLDQYRRSSHLAGCAVLLGGQLLAQSGAALDWGSIWGESRVAGARFLRPRDGDDTLVQGAWAAVPDESGAAVLTAGLLDAAFARQLGAQIGLPVTILDLRAALAPSAGPRAGPRQHALSTGEGATAHLDEPALYLAEQPIRAPTGAVVGILETELPGTETANSLRQLIATLLALTLTLAALSALASFAVGRRLGRPLRALTAAAARIGAGDLASPVPPAPGAEIGTLAATLEEMRGQLLRLTSDLRRQQAEAEAIVTGIVEGVFTVDRERRVRYLNPQAAALLGIAPEAAIGAFCGDVLRPLGQGGVRPCEEHCPIVHARFRGGAHATEHLLLDDGRRRTIVITSAAPAEERQVQVLRDETEVDATRRLRDMVLANISHEFRTPLAAQLASIELLLDQLPALSAEQIGQLVVALQRGTLRLTQLIDNLLESVRIEAGKDAIRHQPVALDEVVEEAVELTRPLLALRGQEVVVELPYPLPTVRGDGPRLTQVFVNLLANANKFAPAGSAIRVGAATDTGTVSLWVEDTGPGLPPLAGQALFERFVRAPGEEPEQGGMGLGLWIVKSIVERHGGQVEARRGDQLGTRMCVTLPVEFVR